MLRFEPGSQGQMMDAIANYTMPLLCALNMFDFKMNPKVL
jgi:hypothetical protein